jgi:hypothetical protein
MKLKRPNKYRLGQSPERMEQYLAVQLQRTLDDITTALQRLSFKDNFKSDTQTVTIPAGTVNQAVRHSLGTVPIGKLIIKANGSSVVDGSTAWNEDNIYLSNPGASAVTLTLVILG